MKQKPNYTVGQEVEAGGSPTLETVVAVVTGNGTNAVVCEGGGQGGLLLTPGPQSALQSAIHFSGGAPVADIVNTASFDADGKFVPGVNIGTDKVLVTWLHFPGDGDAANSWN
jgi:hypothetical protein